MDSLQTFARRKPLTTCLVFFLAIMGLFLGVGHFIPSTSYYSAGLRLVLSALMLFALNKLLGASLKDLGFRWKGFFTALRLSWPTIFTCAIIGIFVIMGFNAPEALATIPLLSTALANLNEVTGSRLVFFFIFAATIGLFEETFFRTAIMNILRLKWPEGHRSALIIVGISGAAFGLVHLTNLMEHPMTQAFVTITIFQVLQCMGSGFLEGAIYWRSGNMLSPILLHAVYDGLMFCYTGSQPGLGGDLPSTLGILAADAALALIYLRPSKTAQTGIALRL
jgi:membrane protease YdiL (CAAX protease family)